MRTLVGTTRGASRLGWTQNGLKISRIGKNSSPERGGALKGRRGHKYLFND